MYVRAVFVAELHHSVALCLFLGGKSRKGQYFRISSLRRRFLEDSRSADQEVPRWGLSSASILRNHKAPLFEKRDDAPDGRSVSMSSDRKLRLSLRLQVRCLGITVHDERHVVRSHSGVSRPCRVTPLRANFTSETNVLLASLLRGLALAYIGTSYVRRVKRSS